MAHFYWNKLNLDDFRWNFSFDKFTMPSLKFFHSVFFSLILSRTSSFEILFIHLIFNILVGHNISKDSSLFLAAFPIVQASHILCSIHMFSATSFYFLNWFRSILIFLLNRPHFSLINSNLISLWLLPFDGTTLTMLNFLTPKFSLLIYFTLFYLSLVISSNRLIAYFWSYLFSFDSLY